MIFDFRSFFLVSHLGTSASSVDKTVPPAQKLVPPAQKLVAFVVKSRRE